MPNTRTLSDQELIDISHHWRRQALGGSPEALAEAQRHEVELRRRFKEFDQSMWEDRTTYEGRARALADSEELSSAVDDFIVATADMATQSVEALRDLLHNLRVVLQMDIAFVSEFVAGDKVYRRISHADEVRMNAAPGHTAPLETTLCQRVVDGRLPQVVRDARAEPEIAKLAAARAMDIGAYLSTPVVLRDGTVYGTICCISHTARSALGSRQLDSLHYVANIIAAEIEKHR